jgi:hypothetical protein
MIVSSFEPDTVGLWSNTNYRSNCQVVQFGFGKRGLSICRLDRLQANASLIFSERNRAGRRRGAAYVTMIAKTGLRVTSFATIAGGKF